MSSQAGILPSTPSPRPISDYSILSSLNFQFPSCVCAWVSLLVLYSLLAWAYRNLHVGIIWVHIREGGRFWGQDDRLESVVATIATAHTWFLGLRKFHRIRVVASLCRIPCNMNGKMTHFCLMPVCHRRGSLLASILVALYMNKISIIIIVNKKLVHACMHVCLQN